MDEHPHKKAFSIIYNHRTKDKPLKKTRTINANQPSKRTRKLTMNVQEITRLQERHQLSEDHSANPEIYYGGVNKESIEMECELRDELEGVIPFEMKNSDIEIESPFCLNIGIHQQGFQPQETLKRQPNKDLDDFTM